MPDSRGTSPAMTNPKEVLAALFYVMAGLVPAIHALFSHWSGDVLSQLLRKSRPGSGRRDYANARWLGSEIANALFPLRQTVNPGAAGRGLPSRSRRRLILPRNGVPTAYWTTVASLCNPTAEPRTARVDPLAWQQPRSPGCCQSASGEGGLQP